MSPANAQEIWVSTVQPRCQSIGASLRRRWRWVTMFGLAALALGTTIAARSEPQYTARARIRLLGDHANFLISDSRSSADDAATLRTQYYVLHSLRILLPVAERLNLAQRWDTDLRGATSRLMEMVTPRKMLDANVTELKVTAPDGQLAADIANSVVDVYSTEANQPRTEQANLTLARLSREADEQARRLADTEQEVNDLQRQTGLDISHGEVSVSSLNPMRQMLIQAEGAVIESQIRVESLMQASKDPLMALETADQSDQIARRVAAHMIETEGRVDELSRRYGDDHPIMRSARRQLDEARSAASEQVVRLIEMAKTEQQAAESKAAFAWQRLGEAEQTLTKASGSYGQLLVAGQRQEVQKNLHKLLLDRMQKMQLDVNLAGPAAEVIEPAMAPSVPELGTPLQIVLIALGIGLGAGIAAAVGVDRLDGTIRGPEEVEWQLNMPLLGTISRNKAMEDFRMVRNSIDFSDHTLRTLCVTGADHREGTSVTAVNLGRAWAEHGARVLLIDANLRSPSLHKLLGIANDAGLVDHLARQRPLEEVVIHTSMTNVSVLPAGKVGKSGAPALTPQQVSEVLLWARSHADIIIFDSPAVLHNSDSSILARQADGTILVARQRGSSVWNLRRAIHVLNGTGEGLMGIVLTAVPAGASWDPMPLEDIEQEQTAERRTATARLRKRNRNAA